MAYPLFSERRDIFYLFLQRFLKLNLAQFCYLLQAYSMQYAEIGVNVSLLQYHYHKLVMALIKQPSCCNSFPRMFRGLWIHDRDHMEVLIIAHLTRLYNPIN